MALTSGAPEVPELLVKVRGPGVLAGLEGGAGRIVVTARSEQLVDSRRRLDRGIVRIDRHA